MASSEADPQIQITNPLVGFGHETCGRAADTTTVERVNCINYVRETFISVQQENLKKIINTKQPVKTVTWTTRTVGQAATKRHIVLEGDIFSFFENEENAKEYNKYLQACISAVHKMRRNTVDR